jgi:small-conductance mechanosensitive channel
MLHPFPMMRDRAFLRVARALTSLAALATVPARAHGQPAQPARTEAGRAAIDTAALVVQHRTIVVFRASLGALSAADRAAAAARRIDAVAEIIGIDSVAARTIPEGMLVAVGPHPIFTITQADVDTLGGATLAQTTGSAVSQLRTVLLAAREERSVAHLVTAVAFAALATLVFLIALRLLRAARRFALARLPAARSQLADIAVGGFTLLSTESLLVVVRRLVELIAWAAGLFMAYLWLAYVLTRFAYTRPWGEALGAYLTTTTTHLALVAVSGIPGLFTVVLIFIVTRWIGRVVAAFFDAVETGGVEVPWVHPETANPTKRIAVALLWLFAVILAYPYVPGSGSDVFKGVSVFAGLVLSLGSSGIMNQAMSGLVLMYSRALKPGDYVRVGETEGTVTELGMLSTKISTTKREEVTLPNAVVVGATIKNFSRCPSEQGLLVYTSVTIGYDAPWRQVEGLLLMAARRTAELRDDSPPFVLKTALSDFYVEYQLNAAVTLPATRVRVLDALHANVLDVFNEYGVQIMSPHFETNPPRPVVVPSDQWYAPPADVSARHTARVPVSRTVRPGETPDADTSAEDEIA